MRRAMRANSDNQANHGKPMGTLNKMLNQEPRGTEIGSETESAHSGRTASDSPQRLEQQMFARPHPQRLEQQMFAPPHPACSRSFWLVLFIFFPGQTAKPIFQCQVKSKTVVAGQQTKIKHTTETQQELRNFQLFTKNLSACFS